MLHKAFTELLEEKRFEDFTVNELCQRAMIRRTTFYKHFGDKYEYFEFYTKEICRSFQDQLPPDVMTEDVNQYFLYMSREFIRFLRSHEALVQNANASSVAPVLYDSLIAHITQDIMQVLKRGKKYQGLSPLQFEGFAAFYSGGLLSAIRVLIKHGKPLDEDQILQTIQMFLNNGMPAEHTPNS